MLLILTVALVTSVITGAVFVRKYRKRLKNISKHLARLTGLSVDTTPWYQLEQLKQRLKDLEERIRRLQSDKENDMKIMDAITDGLLIVEEDGRIVFANERSKQFFDMPELQGRKVHEIPETYPILEGIKRALKTGESQEFDTSLHRKEHRDVRVMVIPVELSDGEKYTVVVIRDITNEREAERMLREFVADVTHELRTPLTSIHGYAETLLADGLKDQEMAKHFLEIIEKESARMGRLINDLLDLERLETGRIKLMKEPLKLKSAVKRVLSVVKPLGEELGVRIHTELDEDVYVFGDYDRIVQMILNLVDNAIKYTSVKEHGDKEVFIRVYRNEKGEGILEVEDTGIGIPKSAQNKLFRRFYRVDKHRSRKLGGTGLGLAITKEIADKHGARLEFESEAGIGTIFRVFFPPCRGDEDEYAGNNKEKT
ncbi:MAG: PAS domain-containing protein [Thermotogae bacterium]|nr:PAS domain-containing protein [Thermotogota bacterium]